MNTIDRVINETEASIVRLLETDGQSEQCIIDMMNCIYRLVYELNALKINKISIVSQKEKLVMFTNVKEGIIRSEKTLSSKAFGLNKIMLYLNTINPETVNIIGSLI